ncbi:MAG: hypothetical protein DMG36_01090 [Acidobacteria bacterium]|nr:MAG: hypothetical protein DMG36_01090 [Acidobacteriota bacterium]
MRPDSAAGRSRKGSTLRLGRFKVIPIADALPAASEALEALSQETQVPIVTLRSLSLRELAQNTGVPPREAELVRQRDFDELFFFAGVSPAQIETFFADGGKREMGFRQHGVLWSAAIGASLQRCVGALSKLYDRALRYHAHSVALATADLAPRVFPFCDRSILLTDGNSETAKGGPYPRAREVQLRSPDVWEQVLENVVSK